MGSMMIVVCKERQPCKAKKIGFPMSMTKLVVLFVEPFEKVLLGCQGSLSPCFSGGWI